MKYFFEVFFVAVLSLLVNSAAWATPITIVVYGDSLTSGYQMQPEEAFPAKLQRKMQAVGFTNFIVVNMSVPGETTTDALDRVSSMMVRNPDIGIVELGSNDILRGVNPAVISNNVGMIISTLMSKKAAVILMGAKAPPNMGYSYVAQIDSVYQNLANFYRIPFYPFALEGIWGKPELNQADGYHPNGRGVDVMVEGMYPLVDQALRWKMNAIETDLWQKQVNGITGEERPAIIGPTGQAPKPE